MIRKLIGLLVLLGFWAPQGALALGLGEMRLTSALNEPLRAEIQLKSAGDLSDSQIRVQLASIEDFEKAGVDRQFFLNNLRFSVKLGNNKGPDVIVVTTSQPVREPYLDFVLELRWPTGRLLREYTALLDLPVFTDEAPVAVAAPQKEKPAPEEVVEQRVKSEPEVVKTAPAQSPVSEKSPEKEKVATADSTAKSATTNLNEYGPTSRNDTLWGIATRVRADRSVSIQQTMLALQRLNPDAFSNNNINLLKTGKVLRVPTVQEIKDIAFQNAYEEVAAQNRQWRQDEPGNTELPQLDARPVEPQQAVAPEPEVEGHLVLAAVAAETKEIQMESGAGGEGDSKGASSAGGSNAAEDSELAADLEHLEKIKRENEELDSRLEDMEEQLTTLQKLVTLKDEELAALQASGVSRDGNDGTKQTTPDETVVATTAVTEATTEKPKATDSNAKAQVSDLSLWDTILSNTLYLAIGAVVLVLLMLALLVSRRNAQRNDFEPTILDSEDSISSPDDVYLEGKRLIASSADETLLDKRPSPIFSKPLPAGLDEDKEALRQQIHDQSNNVIGEADIFIAYGRHQQAIYLLLNAIEEQPRRVDYRLKLLEVYADIKDQAGFNAQYKELLELNDFDAQESVRQLLQAASLSYWLDDRDAPSARIAGKETDSRQSPDELAASFQEELAAEADDEASAPDTDLAIEPGLDDYDLAKLKQDLVAEDLDLDTESDRLLENELDLGSELNLHDDEEATATDKTLASGEQSAPQANTTEFALELDESAFEDLTDQEDIHDSLSSVPDFGSSSSRQVSGDNFWGKTTTKRESTATIHDFPTELRNYKDTDVVDDDDLLKSDLELLGDADEVATKLDLARAYIDMGDTKGARDILEEVLQEGATKQKDEAIKLLSRIA